MFAGEKFKIYFKWFLLAAAFIILLIIQNEFNLRGQETPKGNRSSGIFANQKENQEINNQDTSIKSNPSEKIPSLKINYLTKEEENSDLTDSIPKEKSDEEKVSPDQNVISLKKFGNEMGNNLKPISLKMKEDAEVFEKAWQTPNQDTLTSLEKIGDRYVTAGNSLNTLIAPEKSGDLLKNLANSYLATGNGLKTLPENLKDGKIIGEAWQSYAEKAAAANTAFVNIMKFFEENKIKFSPSEDGYIFMFEMAY